jgi:hypothetical protein
LEPERRPRGRIERAGARIITALVSILIVSVLVLTARAVRWNELFAAIRGDAGSLPKTKVASKVNRPSREKTGANHPAEGVLASAKTAEGSKEKKDGPVESVRAMPQRIEELTPIDEQPQAQEAKLSPATARVDSPSPSSGSGSSANSKAEIFADGPHASRADAKSSEGYGLVTINSPVQAKIYINGQFSGTTPRTVRMNTGDYLIKLTADGYEDWTRRVQLKNKQQVGVAALMKKRAAPKD